MSVFVEVDMVGSAQSQHAEIGCRAVGPQLRQNVVTKIPVQRIAAGQMVGIVHRASRRIGLLQPGTTLHGYGDMVDVESTPQATYRLDPATPALAIAERLRVTIVWLASSPCRIKCQALQRNTRVHGRSLIRRLRTSVPPIVRSLVMFTHVPF
jgi:hypothetical protein